MTNFYRKVLKGFDGREGLWRLVEIEEEDLLKIGLQENGHTSRIMNVLLMKRKVGVKDMSIRKMINRGKILNNVLDFFLSQLSI